MAQENTVTNTKAIALLKAARGLLKKGWTQHTLARNSDGDPRPPQSPAASCWCMSGALHAVSVASTDAEFTLAWDAIDAVTWQGRPLFSAWNDHPGRTQGEVLAVMDMAIEYLANGES